jgi:membrane-associated protein
MRLLDRLMDLLAGLDHVSLMLITVTLTMLETTALIGLMIPGDLAVLLAGSTASTPGRFAGIFVAAGVGTYLGELGGYAIGRAAGPKLRRSRFIGERRWARAEAYLAGKGARVLVPVRFVSVVHAVVPIVAGTVRMPFKRFAFWAGIGAIVWAAVYTSVGAAAGTAYREFGHLGLATSAVLIAAAAITLALRSRARRPSVTSKSIGGKP